MFAFRWPAAQTPNLGSCSPSTFGREYRGGSKPRSTICLVLVEEPICCSHTNKPTPKSFMSLLSSYVHFVIHSAVESDRRTLLARLSIACAFILRPHLPSFALSSRLTNLASIHFLFFISTVVALARLRDRSLCSPMACQTKASKNRETRARWANCTSGEPKYAH